MSIVPTKDEIIESLKKQDELRFQDHIQDCKTIDRLEKKIELMQKIIDELEKSNEFYAEKAVIMEDSPYPNDLSEVCSSNLCVEVEGKLARQTKENVADLKRQLGEI